MTKLPLDRGQVRDRGLGGDRLLAFVLMVVALGNLLLPEEGQAWFGVDYLYLAVAVLSLVILFRMQKVFQRAKVWLWSVAIAFGALPNIAISGVSPLGVIKLLAIAWIILFALAASAFYDIERGARVLLAMSLTVGVMVSVLSLLLDETTVGGRGTLFSLNPIGVSRVTGLAVVVAVVYAIYARRRRMLFLGVALIGAIATTFTLSRGPLLSAFIGISVGLVLLLRTKRVGTKWLILLIGTALVAAVVGVTSGLFPFGSELLRGDSGRSNLFAYAWQHFRESPMGIGWGNFNYVGDIAFESDDSRYPHNLYLEAAAEGGIFAIVAVILATGGVFVAGVRGYARRPSRESLAVLVVYVYALVNAQVSSDIAGNRMLWVFMALTAACAVAADHRSAHGAAPSAPVRLSR